MVFYWVQISGVWIENPSGSRLAQWGNVKTNNGNIFILSRLGLKSQSSIVDISRRKL